MNESPPSEIPLPPALLPGGEGRRPAFNPEAEQAVLGAILLDNGLLDQAADQLSPDDFYIGAHRTIFRAILDLNRRGEPVDPVTLRHYLTETHEMEAVGGPAYPAQLMNSVPLAGNVKAYARMVHDQAVLRALAQQASGILERIYQVGSRVDEVLEAAEQGIFQVAERQSQRRSDYHHIKPVLLNVLDVVENMMNRREEVTGVTSGFADLDQLTAGLQPADLIILAGRPSMGKTALALNMAANAAILKQVPVGVFSLEMSKEQLALRLLASQARVNASNLRTGRLSNDDHAHLSQAADRLSQMPIYIDDTPALTIAGLRAKARRLKRERQIGLLVVDYLQLMQGSQSSGDANRVQEISEISRGLKAVAKELHLPVIALSQLSRSVEGRTDKRPILSDLRESGSIEQDADVVMFVFREEYYKPDNPALHGLAELIVAKQRNGPTKTIKLTFLHAFTRFENLAQGNY